MHQCCFIGVKVRLVNMHIYTMCISIVYTRRGARAERERARAKSKNIT
jgi:hypothetical protein